jgi:hypothetical protein
MGNKKRKQYIYPPEDGWQPKCHYLVDISFSSGNPIHRCIFYTGHLQDGKPCGYNKLFNEDRSEITDVYYMRAVKLLYDDSQYINLGMPNDHI